MAFTNDQLVIFAARAGNLLLLEKRALEGGDLNYVDPKHGSALVEAITHRHLPIIDWLLANGADINARSSSGIGPLEIALSNPDPKVVYCLVRAGAKLNRTAKPYYKKRLEACLKKFADKKTKAENSL